MGKKIVVLGGGTGTYTVLTGLKKYPLEITAIVSMADSGGSAKKERDEFGMLPVSDVRKALLALAEEEGRRGLLRELLNYRFSKGVGVKGTTFGNLFLVALSEILGSQEKAIEEAGKFLGTKGRVLPVTLGQTSLVAEYDEGVAVEGEHEIDEPLHDGRLGLRRVYLRPEVQANPLAIEVIREAGLIVVGPGDLFTSILPVLLVKGIAEELSKAEGKRAFILNLMNKFGQTNGFTASRYLGELEKHSGLGFEHVLVNSTQLPEEILRRYAVEEGSFPFEDDLDGEAVIRGDFLSKQIYEAQAGDKLKRSLLRHDPEKLAKVLTELLED